MIRFTLRRISPPDFNSSVPSRTRSFISHLLSIVMPSESSSKDYVIDSTGTNSQVSTDFLPPQSASRSPDLSDWVIPMSMNPRFMGTLLRISIGFAPRNVPSLHISRLEGHPSLRARRGYRSIDSLNCFILYRETTTAVATTATAPTRTITRTSAYFCLGSDPWLIFGVGMAATITAIRMEASTTTTVREERRTRPPLASPTAERNKFTCYVWM